MKRFDAMITGGATVIGSIAVCAAGLPFHASNATLGTLAIVGAVVGLVGSLIYQAFTPVK